MLTGFFKRLILPQSRGEPMDSHKDPAIEDQLTLEYRGPITELGRMNSYEVAGYIIAFSNFLGIASRRIYGERIELRTEIQGFRNNSFDIDFFLQVAGLTALGFSQNPLTVKDLITLIRDSIRAWIHLKGLPPKEILPQPNKINATTIINQNGDSFCNAEVITVITNPKAGEAVEHFIKNPLQKGASQVHINSKSEKEIALIEEKDAPFFVPINIDKTLIENIIHMHLLIESANFKENNKWRFFDGHSSFYADIEDKGFLRRVDAGEERFGKGDALEADVRISQSGSRGSLKMEHTIIKVLKHEIGTVPDKLL